MHPDPFEFKKLSKCHPSRLAFTLAARYRDRAARRAFDHYALPEKVPAQPAAMSAADLQNTAVTPLQMGQLLLALAASEKLPGTVCAEIGCYRGVTTRFLASQTGRKYIAVDPYSGYGGSDEDLEWFKKNTHGLANLVPERAASGVAARAWRHGPIGFVFIDAVHDYANTAFDIQAWSAHLAPGAFMALHDTDNVGFAGTRRAAFEASQRMELWAHVENLVILRRT